MSVSATIEKYGFETAEGNAWGDYTTFSIDEARVYARENGLRIVAYVFAFSESEVIEDHTDCEEIEG